MRAFLNSSVRECTRARLTGRSARATQARGRQHAQRAAAAAVAPTNVTRGSSLPVGGPSSQGRAVASPPTLSPGRQRCGPAPPCALCASETETERARERESIPANKRKGACVGALYRMGAVKFIAYTVSPLRRCRRRRRCGTARQDRRFSPLSSSGPRCHRVAAFGVRDAHAGAPL